MSNLVLRDAIELPLSRGFQIGVTLDALLTFLKSGDFSGHLKEVKGVTVHPGFKCGSKGLQ